MCNLFCVVGLQKMYGRTQVFKKSNKGLLCTQDLVCSFFKFICYIIQRESDKYNQSAGISFLCIPIQTFNIPPSCPDYPSCRNNRGKFAFCLIGFDIMLARYISIQSGQTANRPFYRYAGHIELIRFKEYYRMPKGHEHISFVFSSAFRDIFS